MFEYSFSENEDINNGFLFKEKVRRVELNNLCFSYPNQINFLENINITFIIGEISCLIGETGSGKTTLRKILERFYNYNNGNIIINDGYKLKNIPINIWRSKIGVVHQEIHLFNGSLLDNISLGRFNYPEVESFCLKWGFSKYFEKLPNGYNTFIGENGIKISGGQKQLISIARCLINNYDVIIFDEATSAIDRKTEDFIIELLHEIKNDKIIIFITHKLNLLPRLAGKIYLIEKGKISINGNHNDIMKMSDFY